MNTAENLGAILKDRVEASLSLFTDADQLNKDDLLEIIEKELEDMSKDLEHFEALLYSYPSPLKKVKKCNGYATKY